LGGLLFWFYVSGFLAISDLSRVNWRWSETVWFETEDMKDGVMADLLMIDDLILKGKEVVIYWICIWGKIKEGVFVMYESIYCPTLIRLLSTHTIS